MKRTTGFTVIEIIVAILFLASATVILFTQRQNLLATQRDASRKTAVNAMYYSLEEVYYGAHNNSYPSKLDSSTLPSVDPAVFTDPSGNKLGDSTSSYRYEPTNCSTDGICKSYTLRALLEKEADYVKTSRHQ